MAGVEGGLETVRLQAIRCGPLPVANRDVHERVGLDYMNDKALLCSDRPGSDDAALRIQVCTACIPSAQRVRRSEDDGAAAFVAEAASWAVQEVPHTVAKKHDRRLTASPDDELPTESM